MGAEKWRWVGLGGVWAREARPYGSGGYFLGRGLGFRGFKARRRLAIAFMGFSIAVMRAVRTMIQMSGLWGSRGSSVGCVGSIERVGCVVVSFIGFTFWVLVDEFIL